MGLFDLFKRPKVPYDVIIAADLEDRKAAIYCWELSAKQGNVDAMNDLARGYSEFANEENLSYSPVPLGRDSG